MYYTPQYYYGSNFTSIDLIDRVTFYQTLKQLHVKIKTQRH